MIAGYTACIKVYVRHLLVSEYSISCDSGPADTLNPPGPGGGPLALSDTLKTCKKLTQAVQRRVGGASTLPERRAALLSLQRATIMGRKPDGL